MATATPSYDLDGNADGGCDFAVDYPACFCIKADDYESSSEKTGDESKNDDSNDGDSGGEYSDDAHNTC